MSNAIRSLGVAVAEEFLDTADATRLSDRMLGWLGHPKAREMGELLDRCESPIERRFVLGLCCGVESPFSINEVRQATDGSVFALLDRKFEDGEVLECSNSLHPQESALEWDDEKEDEVEIGRVDFVLRKRGTSVRLAVELDGHEWHEKTKEQSQRDKSRDRRLTRSLYTVVRFTGSETHIDPIGVANEVAQILDSLTDDREMNESRLALEVLKELGASREEAHALLRKARGLPLLPASTSDEQEAVEE